ncbi:hypothetical protein A7982_12979 [Minicystis rosea]|nr:hypothetical protein A7982_12979 [Minicystis rosea]
MLLVGVLAAGCGDEAVAPAYVGTVAGSDAVVGLVGDGEHVQLYLCGGATSYAELTRWFQGPIAADGTFSIESGGFVATGSLTTGKGEVKTESGELLSWSVARADGELSGLYAAMDGSCRTGVVVGDFDGDGSIDVQGTWCNGKDLFAQVTPLTPIAITDRGIRVRVDVDPPKDLYVDRVRVP